jgi:SAM-dependent methyltransferase
MEPTDHNRRAWDEAHRRRAQATADRPGLPAAVRARLSELTGRHVLHLGCRSGEATAELQELGALVTAVEPSGDALALARGRAPGAAFVQAEVHALPVELRRGRFDLVYGDGEVAEPHDLDAWAAGIAAAVRPGGYVLLYERHPVAACVDDFGRWRTSYFESTTLGAVVTALAQAGLAIRRLEELAAPRSRVRSDAGVPAAFVLVAAKPAPFGMRPGRKDTPS